MSRPSWTPAQLESSLTELRNVVSARVVVDDSHVIREVHALMTGDRNPKQVVRDIESTLVARFGVNIDHKTISVAQIGPELAAMYRLRWIDVALAQKGRRASAAVTLERSGEQYVGTADGQRSTLNTLKLVAGATIRAIEEAFGLEDRFALQDIATNVLVGEQRVVVVLISMVGDKEEQLLTGSALVHKNDVSRAVAHATLDAINRRAQWVPADFSNRGSSEGASDGDDRAPVEN
jgi:hypothetical protein